MTIKNKEQIVNNKLKLAVLFLLLSVFLVGMLIYSTNALVDSYKECREEDKGKVYCGSIDIIIRPSIKLNNIMEEIKSK